MNYEILDNGNLKLSLENESDVEELQTMIDRASDLDHGVLAEILEHTGWDGNGILHQVRPEEIGALTNAPILTDEVGYSDDDTDQREIIGRVWWYPNYQILNFAEVLLEEKEVIFTLAPVDKPEPRKTEADTAAA